MSNCTFQAQLVSIMEILAKAAVAEINRRVNDSCAVIRLEMRRSQRDIDALKRKYHVMENELRRTRGRARKKVPTCMIPDQYTPTPRSVCIQDSVCVWSEEHTTVIPEQRQPLPVQDTHIPHSSSNAAPLIKEETEEDNLWSREGDQMSFSHQGPDRATATEDTKVSQTPLDEQQSTRIHSTHTGEQEVTLEVQVKAEEEDEEEKEGGGRKEDEEEDKKEERTDVEIPEEQEEQQGLGQGEFRLEQHGGTSMWTATTSDFNTESYTHTQSVSVPQLPPPPPPPPLIGSATATTMEQSRNGAILMARNTGHGRWGVQGNRQAPDSDHMTREPGISRSQTGFRSGGGPALGVGGFRGNGSSLGIGSYSSTGTSAVGFQSGALRRLRPHQWRSVGTTAASSSSSSSSTSSSLHAERRGYVCSFCPKSFARLSQLKEHLRSHTGEKPFSCATCGRRFTKHCNLVRHAVVHSGEKPYRCPTCAKCFTQSSSLKSHQRTHLMPHHRDGALVSRTQFRGALLSGAGTSQNYRAFT